MFIHYLLVYSQYFSFRVTSAHTWLWICNTTKMNTEHHHPNFVPILYYLFSILQISSSQSQLMSATICQPVYFGLCFFIAGWPLVLHAGIWIIKCGVPLYWSLLKLPVFLNWFAYFRFYSVLCWKSSLALSCSYWKHQHYFVYVRQVFKICTEWLLSQHHFPHCN